MIINILLTYVLSFIPTEFNYYSVGNKNVSYFVEQEGKTINNIELGNNFYEFSTGMDSQFILNKLKELGRNGLEIETYEDHRFAMSFSILGSCDLLEDGRSWLRIKNPFCCAKTFPSFFEDLERLRESSTK